MVTRADRIPFGMRKDTVDTPRGRVVCLRNDPSKAPMCSAPVAIMVNGLVQTKERWSPALVYLAKRGYHAFAYDHLGQYESEGADDPGRYSLESLSDDLYAVLDTISPERPVHVVGGCFGGFVARELVNRAKHRVRSLVLLGSGPTVAESTAPYIHKYIAATVAEGGIGAVFDKVRAQARAVGISERSIQRVRDSYLATRSGFLVGFSQSAANHTGSFRTDLPLLVTHGSADGMWSTAQQSAMASQLNAPLEVIPGAGHSPTVTHPRATADVLARFWAGCPLPNADSHQSNPPSIRTGRDLE